VLLGCSGPVLLCYCVAVFQCCSVTVLLTPLKAQRLRNDIQKHFLPHSKHTASPVQGPTSYNV